MIEPIERDSGTETRESNVRMIFKQFSILMVSFLFVLLISSAVNPYFLDITVRYSDGRLVSGATVNIIAPEGIIYNGSLEQGEFSAELAKGYYILQIKRFGFKDKIVPLSVDKDIHLSLIMLKDGPFMLYGHIKSPTPVKTVYLVRDGIVKSSGNVYPNGLYAFQVFEEGDYELIIKNDETYEIPVNIKGVMNLNITLSLPPTNVSNISQNISKNITAELNKYILDVGGTGTVGETIEILCRFKNETVEPVVIGPDGVSVPVVNNRFIPQYQGDYNVSCGNISKMVSVASVGDEVYEKTEKPAEDNSLLILIGTVVSAGALLLAVYIFLRKRKMTISR